MENRIMLVQSKYENRFKIFSKLKRLHIVYRSFQINNNVVILIFLKDIKKLVDVIFHEGQFSSLNIFITWCSESGLGVFIKIYCEEEFFTNISVFKNV